MMRPNLRFPTFCLQFAAAAMVLLPMGSVCAQNAPVNGTPARPAPDHQVQAASVPVATADAAQPADRAKAYYHAGLAGIYEENALTEGISEDATKAIEEYKYALDADPDSAQLNNELADLYFRGGRVHDAETTARALLKTSPDDINAHKLLGRIYLRQLGEQQGGVSSTSPAGNNLDLAIAEFEKIVTLQPRDIEDRMVLGQLYTVKHEPQKAQDEFQAAQAIEPESEDVVLNLARLYAESGDIQHSIKVIEAVPAADRTPRMEFALGGAYEQLKQPADAIAAYKRAAGLEPDDMRTRDALAQALLNNNELDESLKEYQQIAKNDPENSGALIHISEIERRQGKYQDALTAVQKALQIDPSSLEAGYDEGLLLDVLGRFDDAVKNYQNMIDLTSHANGAYTDEEKSNRGIFLERLAGIYLEQSKLDPAVATYKKMIDMGGADNALRGYQGQVDAYTEAKEFDKAIDVSRQAVAANPDNRDLKLLLASELADHGQADEALSMATALLKNTADDRIVWFAIGQMNIRLRRWKDAEDAFNKADPFTTKKDDRVYLLFLRGELADRQKHQDQAERYFNQALALDASNAMTLNYMGYMLADKGIRLPEALQDIRKAVDLEPMNGAYLDSLGWVYFKMGEYELAEANLRSAAERDQTDPTVHMHLGDLYEKTGRIRLAAAQWQLSLAEFAKSAPADVEPSDVAKVQKKLESARVRLAKEVNILDPSKPN
jgi:tetratricopeptide (TPR) repeat protein